MSVGLSMLLLFFAVSLFMVFSSFSVSFRLQFEFILISREEKPKIASGPVDADAIADCNILANAVDSKNHL